MLFRDFLQLLIRCNLLSWLKFQVVSYGSRANIKITKNYLF